MKPLYALAFAALISAASAAEIPAGTHLLLRLENSVSSRTAKAGDGVYFRTVIPLSAGGRIVVPVGSYAQGIVTKSDRAPRGHGQAGLEIQLVTIMLASGEVIGAQSRVSSIAAGGTSREQQWNNSSFPRVPFGGMFGAAALGAIAGGRTGSRIGLASGVAVAVVTAIAARGHEIELRPGTEVDVAFDRAIEVR
jgi:hypothetical protein